MIIAEMISLFARYFLTVTPPLGERERQPARTLGKERFQVFVAQIGRRLVSDRRVVADVLESIAVHNPDLLATLGDDRPFKVRLAPTPETTPVDPKPNGHTASPPPTEKSNA